MNPLNNFFRSFFSNVTIFVETEESPLQAFRAVQLDVPAHRTHCNGLFPWPQSHAMTQSRPSFLQPRGTC